MNIKEKHKIMDYLNLGAPEGNQGWWEGHPKSQGTPDNLKMIQLKKEGKKMETVLSPDIIGHENIFKRTMGEAEMSIAEYIVLMRDTLDQSRKVNSEPTTAGEEVFDGLREILTNMNSVVAKTEITDAMKHYKRAVTINPDDAGSHFKLGMTYLLLKDRCSAAKEYRVLKSLDPRMADELLQRWNVQTPWSCR